MDAQCKRRKVDDQVLAEKVHWHKRDARIIFVEQQHKYYLDPGTAHERCFPISVSGLYGLYFEPFNAADIVQRYYDKWSLDVSSKYYDVIQRGRCSGQCDLQVAKGIILGWEWKGLLASTAGTNMHRNIEFALSGLPYERHCVEGVIFERFLRDWLEPRFWRVYRLEWSIYCEEAMVAGQIDALFECLGSFHMVDWKRCGKVLDPQEGASFGRYGKCPLDALLDNACNHYFMQQNLYAVILERRYGIVVSSMHLVQIHPSLPTYQVVVVPDLRACAGAILDAYAASRGWLAQRGRIQEPEQ